MKNLITEKYKHLLYKDEINDTFLLTNYMEIYRKSNSTLGCYCWSRKIFVQLQKRGVIFNEWDTSDNLYTFKTDNANLPFLIATGSHSRRVFQNGRWLKDKEKRLAHKIIPFNPTTSDKNNNNTLVQESRTTS
jgi:hypothetical protein